MLLLLVHRDKTGKIIRAAPFQNTLKSGTMARVEPNRKWFGKNFLNSAIYFSNDCNIYGKKCALLSTTVALNIYFLKCYLWKIKIWSLSVLTRVDTGASQTIGFSHFLMFIYIFLRKCFKIIITVLYRVCIHQGYFY